VQTIREWERRDKPKFVVNIDVRDGSVFDDDDYARWNAWKRNYIQVIRNSPDARLMSSTEADSQRVVAEAISLGNPPVEYGPGWGDEEAWGRWAEEKVAALRIPLSLSQTTCQVEVEVAAFDGLSGNQTCRVMCNQELIASFEVSGSPWQWQTHKFMLPASIGRNVAELSFHFESLHPGSETDRTPRALPFKTLLVSYELP
jgi:hypothetical protein